MGGAARVTARTAPERLDGDTVRNRSQGNGCGGSHDGAVEIQDRRIEVKCIAVLMVRRHSGAGRGRKAGNQPIPLIVDIDGIWLEGRPIP